MTTVTLNQQGTDIGLALPAETSSRLGLEAGQRLTLIELADGVKLVRHNPRLERQMALARDVLRSESEALRQLGDE